MTQVSDFLTVHWNPSLCEHSPPSGSSTQNPSRAWHGSRLHGQPGLAGSRRADGTREVKSFQWNCYDKGILGWPWMGFLLLPRSYLLPVAGQLFVCWEVRRRSLVVCLADKHGGRQVKSPPSSNWHEKLKGLWHVRILVNKQKKFSFS